MKRMALLLGAAAWGGCMAGAPVRPIPAAYDVLYDAALRACDELGLQKASFSKGAEVAQIEARRVDGTRVGIQIRRMGPDQSGLSVRHGTFDNAENRRAADQIHEKILEVHRRGPSPAPSAASAGAPSSHEMQRHYLRNVSDLFAAAKGALWNSKWSVTSESISGGDAKVSGRSPSGVECTITLSRAQAGRTRTVVHVRTHSVEEATRLAREIHGGIAKVLGSGPEEKDP